MKITVRAFGKLLRVLNRTFDIELNDQSNIHGLLQHLASTNPSTLSPLLWDSTLTLLINGRNIYSLHGMNTVLTDGDIVTLIPFVVGG